MHAETNALITLRFCNFLRHRLLLLNLRQIDDDIAGRKARTHKAAPDKLAAAGGVPAIGTWFELCGFHSYLLMMWGLRTALDGSSTFVTINLDAGA